MKNPRLYAWERAERRIALLEHEMEIARMVSTYNKDVCRYCPQVYCEPEKEESCMTIFYEHSKR